MMLPANLAKSRAAGARGLGELLMVSPHTGSGMLQTLRYSPYSVPVSTNNAMVAALSQQPLALTNHSTAAAVGGTSPLQAALAAAQAAVAAGQQQQPAVGHTATHGLHHAASAAHQLPQLQLIGLDSNGQLSSLSQLLSAAAASGQFGAATANHHGCKVAPSLSVPTTLSSSQAAICYSNPFTNALVASGQQGQASSGLGSGAGTPTSGHAHPHQLHHSHHHQAPNLGYNVSDLLNLQGLQGLQVPVGL